MNEAKHTPGPWAVERRFSNECEIVPRITCARDDDRGCGWIADIIGAPYLGHKSTLPNAHLIAAAPDLLNALESPTWLVWSNEHAAWWGRNRCGYYTDINSAGRYTLEDAIQICGLRSRTGDNPDELIQPSPEWIAARRDAIAKAKGVSAAS